MKNLFATILTTVRAAQNSSPYEFPPLKITDLTRGKFLDLVKGTPWEGNWAMGLLNAILNWLVDIAAVLAVIAIIYSGIMYITSTGQPEKTERAKKNFLWAIIALVVIVLIQVIPGWVYDILGRGAP